VVACILDGVLCIVLDALLVSNSNRAGALFFYLSSRRLGL
jgi:hypothetical protein